ncbi:MAG: error-prone DNA polymerase, partial [Pirellulaceae bacterium]|nr:error-prone DNA polymerase [Pirellulaceae bacterium]
KQFARRTGLGRAMLVRLADADAFGSLDHDRRQALWAALGQDARPRPLPLFDGLEDAEPPPAKLPELSPQQQVLADYRAAGLSLRGHPLEFYRPQLDQLRVTPARRLARMQPNRQVRVAGLVLLRQRPSTAKGITFVTLEDETGTANLIVRQTIWDRYQQVCRHAPAWLAHGKLERTGQVIHLLVNRLEDLSGRLGDVRGRSRDFR